MATNVGFVDVSQHACVVVVHIHNLSDEIVQGSADSHEMATWRLYVLVAMELIEQNQGPNKARRQNEYAVDVPMVVKQAQQL